MPPMRLVLFTLFIFFLGCSTSQGPDVVLIASGEYAQAFDAAVDAAINRGMKPVFLDRRSGVIESNPAVAVSVIDPW